MTEKLTQYAKRRAKLSPEQLEYEKAQRRKKDAQRRKVWDEERRAVQLYAQYKSSSKKFLREMIKPEDIEEFREIFNNIKGN